MYKKLIIICTLLFSTQLIAQNREALLIGNSNYPNKKLTNPINDINLLERKLNKLHFNVTKKSNLNRTQMIKALRNFYSNISSDTIALIYFSGHGVHSTIDNKNYLIPIGGFESLLNEADLGNEAISDGKLLASTSGAKFSILLLDACRSNDFAMARGDKGLGQPQSRLNNDYVISYATEVGKTAKDGYKNSPYAKALAEFLTEPYSIGDIFTRVRAKVSNDTHGKQEPYYSPHFKNILYLSGSIPPSPTPPPTPTPQPYSFEPQMVHINSGSFIMGSNNGDDNEKPPHRVNIGYDFEIGKYEVTIGEYKACVNDGGCKQPEWLDYNIHTGSSDSYKKMCLKDNCPIIGVDWNKAKAYTKWLSRKTGKNYRLPTEAEWEFVARAGTTTKWSFGDSKSSLKNYAWYRGNSNNKTHQVGTKKPNPWGVYDMHGNVWEWCEDWYLDSYNSTPKDGSANHSQKENTKVLHGGSWLNNASDTRSAIRNGDYPSNSYRDVGFRLQRILP